MRFQFIGCGDAFGSGGRFNTCFQVVGQNCNFLIDCGASSLPALKRQGVDRNAIELILITHFHADHFGGVPFFFMEANLALKRNQPLLLAGPPGLRSWFSRAMDTAFPSSPQQTERFAFTMMELEVGVSSDVGPLRVTTFPAVHVEAAGPCLGFRIEVEDRVIAYTGDTEWTDAVVPLGREADLFVCECYTRDKKVKSHTTLADLEAHLAEIRPKRLVLTHMSEDMLAHVGRVPYQTAEDGMVIEL